MRIITRTVWILSLVSFFADIAGEMLYPVIPLYLKEIGFSVLFIGILEGVAEFTAGVSKGYFGKRSDEKGVRLPFVKWGYFLSAISKPMMALFVYPLWVFMARTIDRLGKGLRTAARDAMLSGETTREHKAKVFGFHRGMDTFGAVLGPLAALLYLQYNPAAYTTVFYLAFFPGIIAVLLIFLLKEKKQPASTMQPGNFFSFFKYWKIAPREYKKLTGGLLLFALFNSSDVFLIIKTKEITGSDTTTISAYIFYNIIFAAMAYPMGFVADRAGVKKIFVFGLLLFAIVYTGFAFRPPPTVIFILLFLYGIYAAATDGIAKAWITNIAHDHNTATAIGFYTSCQSVCSLFASIMAGLLWNYFGSFITFIVTAAVTFLVSLFFILYIHPQKTGTKVDKAGN